MSVLETLRPKIVVFPTRINLLDKKIIPTRGELFMRGFYHTSSCDIYFDISWLIEKYLLKQDYEGMYDEYNDFPWSSGEIPYEDFKKTMEDLFSVFNENFKVTNFYLQDNYRIRLTSPTSYVVVDKSIYDKLIYVNGMI